MTLVIIALLVRLWQILLLIFIAFLVATALSPLVEVFLRRGWPRAGAVAFVVTGLIAVLAGVLMLLIPPLVEQGQRFAVNLPGYLERGQRLLESNPDLYQRLQDAANQGAADPAVIFSGFLAFSTGLITGIANAVIVVVLAIYILVDGERIYNWIARYLPATQRAKIRDAMPEISRVVSGYVLGQTISSLLFGAFALVTLWLLGVPEPLLLAIVAAFADAIPLAGVLIATLPAVLLALTVGIPQAVAVLLLYIGYQQVENYLIVPRVYRSTLRVSSFAVLIAVLIGGQLLGIVGILIALPITAAIPVIERIWRIDIIPGEPS
ncbi:MAG: AI-2E family transporter [Chloroflexota bacterium]|nr:AI-2E family transporter [Chloroflexota bacterium]